MHHLAYRNHSSDIRNTSIFRRCSKRSIFKYFKKSIIKIQRLENWPLYQVFSSIKKKAQKNVKYAYVWIELRVCHYYDRNTFCGNEWIKNIHKLSILYVYYICTHTCIFLHSRSYYYIGFKSMKHRMTNKIHEFWNKYVLCLDL